MFKISRISPKSQNLLEDTLDALQNLESFLFITNLDFYRAEQSLLSCNVFLQTDNFQLNDKVTMDTPFGEYPTISYVAILFGDSLGLGFIIEVLQLLSETQLKRIKQLSPKDRPMQCIEIYIDIPVHINVAALSKDLFRAGQKHSMDACILLDDIFRSHKRMVVFDMDSTLIKQECIDELAREFGVYHLIAPITESAMRGEIDFNESLRRRVSLLADAPMEIVEKVRDRIELTPGAMQLCKTLKKLGYKLALVSGGFVPLANHVKQLLGLDYAFANTLDTLNGKLTGKVAGAIVDGQKKADLLNVISQLEGIEKKQVCLLNKIIAVGDGANDILMMVEASVGIAFNAKPRVQEQADARINYPSLTHVLYLLGFHNTDHEQ